MQLILSIASTEPPKCRAFGTIYGDEKVVGNYLFLSPCLIAAESAFLNLLTSDHVQGSWQTSPSAASKARFEPVLQLHALGIINDYEEFEGES